MLNGRHFLLLGVIACCGLLSVHDGQRQIALCYKIAAVEKELRGVREEIAFCKIRHTALQSPKAVMEKAEQLKLKVQPAAPLEMPAPLPPPPVPRVEPPRSLGNALPASRTVPLQSLQRVPAATPATGRAR